MLSSIKWPSRIASRPRPGASQIAPLGRGRDARFGVAGTRRRGGCSTRIGRKSRKVGVGGEVGPAGVAGASEAGFTRISGGMRVGEAAVLLRLGWLRNGITKVPNPEKFRPSPFRYVPRVEDVIGAECFTVKALNPRTTIAKVLALISRSPSDAIRFFMISAIFLAGKRRHPPDSRQFLFRFISVAGLGLNAQHLQILSGRAS